MWRMSPVLWRKYCTVVHFTCRGIDRQTARRSKRQQMDKRTCKGTDRWTRMDRHWSFHYTTWSPSAYMDGRQYGDGFISISSQCGDRSVRYIKKPDVRDVWNMSVTTCVVDAAGFGSDMSEYRRPFDSESLPVSQSCASVYHQWNSSPWYVSPSTLQLWVLTSLSALCFSLSPVEFFSLVCTVSSSTVLWFCWHFVCR